jgi:hypothetical protein
MIERCEVTACGEGDSCRMLVDIPKVQGPFGRSLRYEIIILKRVFRSYS